MSIFDPGPLIKDYFFGDWLTKNYDNTNIMFFPSEPVAKSKMCTIMGREIATIGSNNQYLKRILALLSINPMNIILQTALESIEGPDIDKVRVSLNAQNVIKLVMENDQLLLGWGIINAVLQIPKESTVAVLIPMQSQLNNYLIRMTVDLMCWWIDDPDSNYEKFVDYAALFATDRVNTLLHAYRLTKVMEPKTLDMYRKAAASINEMMILLANAGMSNEWDKYFGTL